MAKDSNQRRKSILQILLALVLGVSSDTIAEFLASQIDFSNQEYSWWFQGSVVSIIVLLSFWYGVLGNPYVREVFRALVELQGSLRKVRNLSSQYEGLNLPITINGQERFPQWELPSIMCALATGARCEIRAIYVVTPETLRRERSHLAQEGEYFEACRSTAFRAAVNGRKTQDVVKRIFLFTDQILRDKDLLERSRKLVDRHSENGLFGVKVICPAPMRPISDFAIYDDNVVLKLEVEMFERRVSSGLVLWSRNAVSTYARTWDTLWRSPEALPPQEFASYVSTLT